MSSPQHSPASSGSPTDTAGPASDASPPSRPPGTRWQAIWAARWYVLLAAIIVGVLAILVSFAIPKRYSSSALVRVTLPSTAGLSEQSVQAANDLASQDTQVATASPIVARAAGILGPNGHNLTANVSASTVAAQNLIQINARGSSPDVARDRANAMARAFVAYLNQEDAKNASGSAASSSNKLREIQARIQSDELEIDRDLAIREGGKPITASQRARLTTLEAEAASLESLQQGLLVAQVGAGTPTLTVFSPATNGSQTQPKPALYALVAFVVTLLIAAQLAAVFGTRRAVVDS